MTKEKSKPVDSGKKKTLKDAAEGVAVPIVLAGSYIGIPQVRDKIAESVEAVFDKVPGLGFVKDGIGFAIEGYESIKELLVGQNIGQTADTIDVVVSGMSEEQILAQLDSKLNLTTELKDAAEILHKIHQKYNSTHEVATRNAIKFSESYIRNYTKLQDAILWGLGKTAEFTQLEGVANYLSDLAGYGSYLELRWKFINDYGTQTVESLEAKLKAENKKISFDTMLNAIESKKKEIQEQKDGKITEVVINSQEELLRYLKGRKDAYSIQGDAVEMANGYGKVMVEIAKEYETTRDPKTLQRLQSYLQENVLEKVEGDVADYFKPGEENLKLAYERLKQASEKAENPLETIKSLEQFYNNIQNIQTQYGLMGSLSFNECIDRMDSLEVLVNDSNAKRREFIASANADTAYLAVNSPMRDPDKASEAAYLISDVLALTLMYHVAKGPVKRAISKTVGYPVKLAGKAIVNTALLPYYLGKTIYNHTRKNKEEPQHGTA